MDGWKMKWMEELIFEEDLPVEVERAAAVAMDGGISDRVLPRGVTGVCCTPASSPGGGENGRAGYEEAGIRPGRVVLRSGGAPPALAIAVGGTEIIFRIQDSGGGIGLVCGVVADR